MPPQHALADILTLTLTPSPRRSSRPPSRPRGAVGPRPSLRQRKSARPLSLAVLAGVRAERDRLLGATRLHLRARRPPSLHRLRDGALRPEARAARAWDIAIAADLGAAASCEDGEGQGQGRVGAEEVRWRGATGKGRGLAGVDGERAHLCMVEAISLAPLLYTSRGRRRAWPWRCHGI